MKIIVIILISIISTSMMTLFSYIISNAFNRQFREPILLKEVFINLKLFTNNKFNDALAWILHFLIGLLFIVIYIFLWNSGIIIPTISSGILLGFVSGIIGTIGWRIMFNISGIFSKKYDLWYYLQLIIAHLIFGLIAVILYFKYF